MARSLNKLLLIGNLTKDPEVRYTSSGTAVCNFSIATNREWLDSNNQKSSEVTYVRVVAWHKLAEICVQYLKKGSKIYAEGRIANRAWDDKQGIKHYETEMVLSELIMLDSKRTTTEPSLQNQNNNVKFPEPEVIPEPPEPKESKEDINPDDIPF